MAGKTRVPWATATWNPIIGCSYDDAVACRYCWAPAQAARLAKSLPRYTGAAISDNWTGIIKLDEEQLYAPLAWTKPHVILLGSMADVFNLDLSRTNRLKLWNVIYQLRARGHIVVLTTRKLGNLEYLVSQMTLGADDIIRTRTNTHLPRLDAAAVLSHVWIGASCSNNSEISLALSAMRAQQLRNVFLALDPLISRVDMTANATHLHSYGVQWVTCGGFRSTNSDLAMTYRMDPAWVQHVQEICADSAVPFYFSGWGTVTPDGQLPGRLHGLEYHELPEPIAKLLQERKKEPYSDRETQLAESQESGQGRA